MIRKKTMKTRKRLEEERKPKKSQKMKGLFTLKCYSDFDELMGVIETDLVGELNKNQPNWYTGGRNVIPYLHWWSGKPNVDAGENRKKKGGYTNHILSLCLCHKDALNERVGHPISRRTLKPWVEVKESGFEGAGLGLFALKRFKKEELIAIHFAPKKSRDRPEDTRYTFHRNGFYCSVPLDGPLYMGAHYVNDNAHGCAEIDKDRLEALNNSRLHGFNLTAKYQIEAGVEITAGYNLF